MKKKQNRRLMHDIGLLKMIKMMRFTIFIVLVSLSQAFAVNSFSQQTKLTLDMKNARVEEVIDKIENSTEFFFLYNRNLINVDRKIDVKVENESVYEILQKVFKDTDISFSINNRQILLTSRTADANKINTQQERTISGKVTDSQGIQLPGVTIIIKGTGQGSITGADGSYSLTNVPLGSTLVFTFIGMKTQEIKLAGETRINVVMQEETIGIEEVVAVGYGVQKKATLTGAVSAVKGEDIVSTKNENAQNMLTGKISGVRVTQKTAEPGSFNNNFDIRAMGSPLIIIDGIPRTNDDFQRLDPNDIDNMSVLKDASAAIYGVRAANGVVLVTTKKGTNNRVELNYSGSFTWQIPSGLPATVDAMEYMTLRNEQAMHNINGGSPIFNDQQFEDYRTGVKQSVDWYPLVFADYAPQTMHNLNATGGNDKTTYYAGLGYQYQEGFFKSSDLNYTKYNVRSNITTKITDRLTFDLNLNLVMDEQDRPYQDSWWIIRGFWRQGAHIPAYANNDPTKPYHGLIEGDNPISFMDKDIVGYKEYNKKWIQSAASLKYDIPGIKGLYVKGLFSYDYFVSSSNLFQKEYVQYRYDEASDTYSKYTRQSPNRIRRESYFKTQLLSQASLNYDGTFNRHKVGSVLIWEAQKRTSDNFFAQRDLVLPLPYIFAGVAEGQLATMNSGADALYENANLALAGRLNYSFSDKYLAEVLFRYDGSSKFAEGSQWGFFPAASVGWRISEEGFFKNASALSFISQLKVRSSYGKTGDDGASSYQFISGYNYPSSTDRRNFTGGYVFNGSFNASADNKGIPNPFITWYTAKTFDLGTDFEGWDGLLGISFDYFSRKREGLLATRSGGIPTVVGAGLPQENLNGDRTYGFELEVSHRNRIKDFRYNMKGMVSLARVKRLYVERGAIGSSWNNWKNNQNDRLQGVHSGLQGNGQYQSWEEIWSNPTYIGRGTLPGDYKYEDWNGDGEINGNDVHPIRYNQYPWMNFSMIFDASYKGFDLNFLLQGSAMSSLVYGEQLREPMWGSGNSGAMEQFMDRWHPADPKADPYDPATQWIPGHFAYTGSLPDVNSSFNVENGAYLRLKSVELGYTLPSQWIMKSGIKNLRFYVNTYNLFTITKVKFVDPEHPNDTYGYLYPLNKTVSVGLNVKF
ncbi:SusC/RagA family TonB-linked outer membrane protein [Gaoshiqia sp. Z1-71]|uniref:SusC/RagA family TonB-linked outer membrane protein n=1 Tax=Gaoshiqia hydrogeniformans TaxID=3290090 RepID=UPI003BF7B97E